MSYRPPLVSFTSKHFAHLVDRSRTINRMLSWKYTGVGALAVIILDYITGTEISVGISYMLIICFAAWNLRESGGLVVAVGSVVAQAIINGPSGGVEVGTFAAVWNTIARLISFSLIAVVVSGLRYAIELERWRASTDGLTGALNKGAFREAMGRRIARAQRTDAAVVLAYMDLDGFKGVNDYNGHSAGDMVLKAFAGAAANSIRPTDLFARIGGDEFIALLTVPNCDLGDKTAEMLHARLTKILRETGYDVTCSMGALVVESRLLAPDDRLIEAADQLMYEVKRTGKNGLRIARGDPLGKALRTAFPPAKDDSFGDLLAKLDRWENAQISRTAA